MSNKVLEGYFCPVCKKFVDIQGRGRFAPTLCCRECGSPKVMKIMKEQDI